MTKLCVGVVSKNVTEVACFLAKQHQQQMILVPSRRQVDTEGGYVEGWTQYDLMRFIDLCGARNWVCVERDHAGPFQGNASYDPPHVKLAMADAKNSLHHDIDAGFKILHLDPSVMPGADLTEDIVHDWLIELYQSCIHHAQESGKGVLFEVGGEEQTDGWSLESVLRTSRLLDMIQLSVPSLYWPQYAVVQTGTHVMEDRNTGSFQRSYADARASTIQALKMLRGYGVHLKVHNADYLRSNVMRWMAELGVHAVNIAPEYGLVETTRLLGALESYGERRARDDFLKLAFESGKWKKWLAPNSVLRDESKARLAGHYVFSHPDVVEMKERVNKTHKVDLDLTVRYAIKSRMNEHGRMLQWIV